MNPALIMVVLHIKHMRMMNCAIVPNVIAYLYITKYNECTNTWNKSPQITYRW